MQLLHHGTAQIENEVKNGTKMSFDVKYVLEETEMELPYIYYIGYNVSLERNGQKVNLETYETENGFIGIKVPVLEEGKITVKYTGTTIMKISSFASLIGVCLLIGLCVKDKNVKTYNKSTWKIIKIYVEYYRK